MKSAHRRMEKKNGTEMVLSNYVSASAVGSTHLMAHVVTSGAVVLASLATCEVTLTKKSCGTD